MKFTHQLSIKIIDLEVAPYIRGKWSLHFLKHHKESQLPSL